jgi:hypothetical protein
MTNPDRLHYQCHHCMVEAKVATPGCKVCGPKSTSHFVLDYLTFQTSLVCNGCNEVQASQDRPPIDCLNCHQGIFDWWDNQENTWFKLDLQSKTTNENDVWVKGDFDGDYEGVLKPEFRTKSDTPGNALIHFPASYLLGFQISALTISQSHLKLPLIHQLSSHH